ncbi:hypothetical protein GF389_00630 [Candidatus Dojkabacteria bacterium]|nr:hypothetical protein [Candidatus Dojkabacteria bacterium]
MKTTTNGFLAASIAILFFSFLGLVGVFSSNLLEVARAVPLSDPDDVFVVSAPRPNSELVETIDIKFKLYDDDNSNPEYEIALFQPNCTTKYGTIAVNDYSIRNASNVYTKAFNTDGAMLDRPAPADGTYCLKVCTTLKNSTENYSVCDLRQVTLAEKQNNTPVITSTPPNSNYIIGQNYSYDVNASDADGDKLTYSLGNAPDFLLINSSTGQITSKAALDKVGRFGVLVYVRDGQGGTDSQQFEINVVEKPQEELPEVTITSPIADEIVVEDSVAVEWEISGIEQIVKTELFYSTDGQSWKLIETLEGDARTYDWDVSEIEDGEYYLRVVVTDTDGNTYEYVLENFSINDPDDDDIKDAASIIDVVPEEDSEISSVDLIEATFVPSQNAEIVEDSLKVFLNDNDILESCALQVDKLICNVSEIGEGKHKVELSFEDTNGERAEKSWFFDIVVADGGGDGGDGDDGGLGINTSSLLIVFIVCVVALFLIIIPWMLYSIWRGSRREEEFYDYGGGDQGGDYGAYDAYDSAGDVNVNIDPRTDLDSSYYNEPASTPIAGGYEDMDSDYDEYAIGEGDIGGGQDFTPVEPASTQSSEAGQAQTGQNGQGQKAGQDPDQIIGQSPGQSQTQTSGQSSQTDSSNIPTPEELDPGLGEGFDEDDIPDWLKGEDISDPVNTKGQEIDLKTADEKKEELKGADPYSDYGLAQKEE